MLSFQENGNAPYTGYMYGYIVFDVLLLTGIHVLLLNNPAARLINLLCQQKYTNIGNGNFTVDGLLVLLRGTVGWGGGAPP